MKGGDFKNETALNPLCLELSSVNLKLNQVKGCFKFTFTLNESCESRDQFFLHMPGDFDVHGLRPHSEELHQRYIY